jgi:head-tail adaptor
MAAGMKCCRTQPVKPGDVRFTGDVQERRTEDAAKNDHGEIDYRLDASWKPYAAGAYFAVKPLRSVERLVSEQLTGVLTHTLTTRYSSTKVLIRPSMRIRIVDAGRTRIFHVSGPPVDIDERHQWLEIPCVEEVPG